MFIEISDEALKFAKRLAKARAEIKDPATAEPFYYTIRHYDVIYVPRGCGDGEDVVVVDTTEGLVELDAAEDMEEIQVAWRTRVLIEQEIFEGYDGEKHQNPRWLGKKRIWSTENVFFTEEACQKHIDQNRHRYGEDPHPYAVHGFRNPDLSNLIKLVAEIGG